MISTCERIETNRKFDNTQEAYVNMFVEKYFLSRVYKQCERITDVDRQCAGIDYIVDGLNLDLKAQSSKTYLNNPRDTFLLEVSFLSRNGIDTVGWFINPTLVTDAYCFMWIPEADVNENGALSSSESIRKAEIMIVDKHRLKFYVNHFFSDDMMLNLSDSMRSEDMKYYNVRGCYDMHFTYTNFLGEKPVNLIVNKSLLKRFATKYYIVTKDYIKNIL